MEKPIKPISLKRKEFTDGLAKLINNAELPPILLIDILKDTLSMMEEVRVKQAAVEEAEYKKKLEEYMLHDEKVLNEIKENFNGNTKTDILSPPVPERGGTN